MAYQEVKNNSFSENPAHVLNGPLTCYREIENLIKEDELKRAEEEKIITKQKQKQELYERNRQIVLQAIVSQHSFLAH